MTKRSSENAVSGAVSKKSSRAIAVLLCASLLIGSGTSGGMSTARAQDRTDGAPAPLEVRLFEGADFSGSMRSTALEAGQSYTYIERFGDTQASVVRSLRIGASVGVVLFRQAFFGSQDESCAPTLGSDAQPDLIWTGQTADFLPAKAADKAAAALPDAGSDGYGSAILYRRDAGPPPGVLLMKRRRSYGRGCGNILRSFNFDRRFFPLEYEAEASSAAARGGCFNLKGASGDNGPVTGMLRSDRVALLQPSDLDRRYGEQERRFRVLLFDGENCSGESVSLQAPYRANTRSATAADSEQRRDILLSSLLFRDRAQSLRIEALDRAGRLSAKKTATPQATQPAPAVDAPAEQVADRSSAGAAAASIPGKAAQQEAPAPAQKAVPNASSTKAAAAQAPTRQSAVQTTAAPKAADPEPKILPQAAAAGAAQPDVALPTAKLDPMTELPAAAKAAPLTSSRTVQTDALPQSQAPQSQESQTGALAPAIATTPVQPQLSQVQPPISSEKTSPNRTQSNRTQSDGTSSAQAQPAQAQLSQSQAAPEDTTQDPSASDGAAPGTQVFSFPVYDVYRLNFCLSTKGQCGEPAANKWCQMKGFERAVAWRKDDNIGGLFPTFLIGDEQICAQYKCDGFAQITCGR